VLTLQRIAPQTTRMDVPWGTPTVAEPTCIWSDAWSAAVASGLPSDATMDVAYGLDKPYPNGVWVFTTRGSPSKTRMVDGRTCAIKTPR
jgi:hypothetical protein